MTGVINTINFNTPFLQGVPNSRVSPEWIRLLGAVIATVTGNDEEIDFSEIQEIIFTAREPLNSYVQANEFAAMQQTRRQVPALLVSDDLIGMSRSATASAANAVSVADNNATNVAMYPVFVDGISGQRTLKTASTGWTFNPSTGKLTAKILASTGAVIAQSATAVPAGGTAGAGFMMSTTANLGIFFGSGVPVLAAAKGSWYLRTDGTTTNDRAYINTDGATAWTALTTAA